MRPRRPRRWSCKSSRAPSFLGLGLRFPPRYLGAKTPSRPPTLPYPSIHSATIFFHQTDADIKHSLAMGRLRGKSPGGIDIDFLEGSPALPSFASLPTPKPAASPSTSTLTTPRPPSRPHPTTPKAKVKPLRSTRYTDIVKQKAPLTSASASAVVRPPSAPAQAQTPWPAAAAPKQIQAQTATTSRRDEILSRLPSAEIGRALVKYDIEHIAWMHW